MTLLAKRINHHYNLAVAEVMKEKRLMAISVDEVTIDGCSYFVPIFTNTETTVTGFGNIQVFAYF